MNSLKTRLLLTTAVVLILFILIIEFVTTQVFEDTLLESVHSRLAADANALAVVAHNKQRQLSMPESLEQAPDKFSQGLIYDRDGDLLWHTGDKVDDYFLARPVYNRDSSLPVVINLPDDTPYFIYAIDKSIGDGRHNFDISVITVQPASEYYQSVRRFVNRLILWLSVLSLGLLVSMWMVLHVGFKPLRLLALQLQDIESGEREALTGTYPGELVRLVNGLNRLLHNERNQRERYRNTLSDLAHSLKTPLAVMSSACQTQVLQERSHVIGTDQLEMEKTIADQIDRMNQIVGYQLQRALAGRKTLQKTPVSVEPVIRRLCQTLEKVYRHKEIILHLDFESGSYFIGDEQDFMEVMGNLLDNAYRLCLAEVKVSACILSEKNNQTKLAVQVEDDGGGVPGHLRTKILQRGRREDSRSPGQGIGLAVVVDIVESYEGQLEVGDSSLGGALFRVMTPI